ASETTLLWWHDTQPVRLMKVTPTSCNSGRLRCTAARIDADVARVSPIGADRAARCDTVVGTGDPGAGCGATRGSRPPSTPASCAHARQLVRRNVGDGAPGP